MENINMNKSDILFTITLKSRTDAPMKVHTKTVEEDDLHTTHYIKKITRGGKTFDCGLKHGDELEYVNDQSVHRLDRRELKKLLKKEFETGLINLDMRRTSASSKDISVRKTIDNPAEPLKKLKPTQQESVLETTIKEYPVTIGAGEKIGFWVSTNQIGSIYTHQINKIYKDGALDKTVDFMMVLHKEIVSLNGRYMKNKNYNEISEILSALSERGGTIVIGILDDSKIVTRQMEKNGKQLSLTTKNEENVQNEEVTNVETTEFETEGPKPREEAIDSDSEGSVERADDMQEDTSTESVNVTSTAQGLAEFVKEYRIMRDEHTGLPFYTLSFYNGFNYSHMIVKVNEGSNAALSVDASLLLNREVINVNGTCVKLLNTSDLHDLLRGLTGEVVIGVLDNPAAEHQDKGGLLSLFYAIFHAILMFFVAILIKIVV